ncbi:MAG: hypothetical protein ABI072_00715, partial [Edaphobacter sp.]
RELWEIMIGTMSKPNHSSCYREMVKSLRANLANEKDCLYFLHTPLGIINVIKWNYSLPDFIAVMGEDENKKYRFLVFSEEAIISFPLEVKRKKLEASKETLGFKT